MLPTRIVHRFFVVVLLTMLVVSPFGCVADIGLAAGIDTTDAAMARSSLAVGPASPPAPEAPQADPARAQRVMIYNASATLVVPDAEQASDAIRQLATDLGGFLQSLQQDEIIIKVPADRLNEAMDALARIGEVTARRIVGTDVTEEWTDLQMRLKAAEAAHKRLLELMAKAEKVEDMIAIEKEILRATEMIERMKGRLRYLAEAIAYSTITVRLNAPVSTQHLAVQVPFPWVRGLASEFIGGTRPASIDDRWYSSEISFRLPKSFVKYVQQKETTRALSADGALIKVSRHSNYEGGDLAFWSTLIRRTLVETRALAVTGEQGLENDTDIPGRLLIGSKTIASQPHTYMIAVVPTRRYVYVYEAWGKAEVMAELTDTITDSMNSLRP